MLQPRLAIPVLAPGRPTAWLRRGSLPAPLHLSRSLLGYRHLGLPDRIIAARAALALARVDPDDPAADRQSFGRWLRAHGQSPAGDRGAVGSDRPPDHQPARRRGVARRGGLRLPGRPAPRRRRGRRRLRRAPLQRVHGDAALSALDRGRGPGPSGLARRARGAGPGRPGLVILGGGERRSRRAPWCWPCPHDRVAPLLPEGAVRDPDALPGLGSSPIVNLHIVLTARCSSSISPPPSARRCSTSLTAPQSSGPHRRTVPGRLAVGRRGGGPA